jgi:hypothetical protein
MDANDRNAGRRGRARYRSGWVTLLLPLLLPLTPLSNPDAPDPHALARRIAERYGVDSFARVQSVHFVFNVHYKGNDVARAWTWFPREDSVVYNGKDAGGAMITAAYSRKNPYSLGSDAVKAVDKMFINDQYWLFFPYHLIWDKDTKMEASAMPVEAKAQGKAEARRRVAYRMTVTYPSEGGYTPGDAYDLFVDSAGTVVRWVFRKGNGDKPTREAMWSEPVEKGGLNLSLERPGMGDDFRLKFSDVQVVAR